MFKHSNIQSQNQQASCSHRNQPQQNPIAHSEAPHPAIADSTHKEWVGTYINGQYFLTDPQSMNKLNHIQAEIILQKNRLVKLEQDNISNNDSFLSYQNDLVQKQSNKSFCVTEFNQSKHVTRQEKVKNQLEKQEEIYRQKIKNTEKQKAELKKNIKILDERDIQKVENQNQASQSPKKSSTKNKIIQQEAKQKSYHKSRIQKSIKENISQREQLVKGDPSISAHKGQSDKINFERQQKEKVEKSNKDEVEKSGKIFSQKQIKDNTLKSVKGTGKSQIDKQIQIVIVGPSEVNREKSVVGQGKQQKAEGKSTYKQVDKSVKEIQIQEGIQKSVKNDLNRTVNKSQRNTSNNPKSLNQFIQKSQKSYQQEPFSKVKQPENSQKKSVKKSEKKSILNEAQSLHPQSIRNSDKLSASIKKVSEHSNQGNAVQSQHSVKAISQNLFEITQPPQKKATSVKNSSLKNSSKHSKLINKEQQHFDNSSKISENVNQLHSKIQDSPAEKSQVAKSVKSKTDQFIQQIVEEKNQIEKISQKSMPRSNRAIEHQIVKEQDAKLRTSNAINDLESRKSSSLAEAEIKSTKSNINQGIYLPQEIKSKKSYIPSQKQINQSSFIASSNKSKKYSKIQNNIQEEAISKKSDKNTVKNNEVISNKLSQKNSQQLKGQDESRSKKQKGEEIVIESKSLVSEKQIERNSFTKKSAAPVVQAKQTGKNSNEKMMDRSIQYSRMSLQQPQKLNNNTIKFDPSPSQKNSSFLINNNEVSMDQSSHLKLQMLNNELKSQIQEVLPQYNIEKSKEQSNDNRSEKKSKSFIIHSRQGSLKDRSEKNYDKMNNSKLSSPSKKSRGNRSGLNDSSLIENQSVTKQEIAKLQEHITLLQEKLKKVQERQEQMEKFEGTLSKIHQIQNQETGHKEIVDIPVQIQSKPQDQFAIENLAQISVRVHPRLQIESSILQVNTLQQTKKKQQKDSQHNQKSNLKDQISRLKRIIRDMQIQKIKSIDHETQLDSPSLNRGSRNLEGKQQRQIERQSQIQKQSISSFDGIGNQRRLFASNNKRLLEDAGKIVHNNSSHPQRVLESPRRRSFQKIKLMSNQDDVAMDAVNLPNDSINKKTKNNFYSEVRKNDFVGKIGQKDKDFHNFIQSSRVIAQQIGYTKAQAVDSISTQFKNFNKISVVQDVSNNLNRINYSRIVEQMKKNNPEQQEILPQIHLRDIKMPNLPQPPNANMTQEQLLNHAKATYMVFGINVDQEDKQLCVKKYKNCVIFTLNNQHHQCILWHFSGKFYMGSWRSGEPGQGQKDGQGLQLIPDKHVYKGQFLKGKKNGTGIIKLSNGNIYDGQWIQGIKNGRGVYLDSATKVIYSGEWRDGKKQGQGFLKLSQKEYYYGSFVRSIKEGFGIEVFVNGDKYKGEYKNGKFHGKGKYIWANGSCYQGQFNQGVRHGQGNWKSTKINGDIYIGTYENDKKTGYGRYVWANGCMYQGGFSNDVKHGKGRLTYQDGKEIKGIWEQGNLTSTQNEKRAVEHQDEPLRRSVKVTAFGYPSSSKRI